MAFDGSAVYSIVRELNKTIVPGRIIKIAQTDRQELFLTIKNEGSQFRLLISVNPGLPMIYLTDRSKTAPLTAPAFCMLLRKHLINGKIQSITQPSMERIIDINIEHFDEMGDVCTKTLTVELMGKHSNIILRQDDSILDSIRHVSAFMSSVREVLPGRKYFIPFSEGKINPLNTCKEEFIAGVFSSGSMPLSKALYSNITGFSPAISEEILFRAGIDSDRPANSIDPAGQNRIYAHFTDVMEHITKGDEDPVIYYKKGVPQAFGTFNYQIYNGPGYTMNKYDSISRLLFDFYSQKQAVSYMHQKTSDIRQTVNTLLNRDNRKYDLQLRQLKDTEKMDRFKVYGELLTAYGYSAESGISTFETTDFYTGKQISIPLDASISAVENGKNYFKKYSKLKRTRDALNDIIKETRDEIEHLESILISIDMAQTPEDIADIRHELSDSGYIKKQNTGNKKGRSARTGKSEPLHYISSDGFHMYVGKNNYQNEYISFKIASGNDWWFHAKDIPGSHVIVKCDGTELPDKTFEEASSLAAHYSRSEDSSKVEVQYTQKKNLKKPPQSKPGFVIFNTYYSMAASTDISDIKEAD